MEPPMDSQQRVPLGVGIYTRAEAARLLGMTPQRISRWVCGYRYSWTLGGALQRGRQPPVIKTDLPRMDDALAVSFLELMELRVVRAFIQLGVPLQTVRVAWNHARAAFRTDHPFANRRVYVDEGRIFMPTDDRQRLPDLLEVSSRRQPFQLVAGRIFLSSAEGVDFDRRTRLARRWWPLGIGTPIILDPRIAFGAPVVEGTGIRTEIIALYGRGRPPAQVAGAFEVDEARVRAALRFETQLRRAA